LQGSGTLGQHGNAPNEAGPAKSVPAVGKCLAIIRLLDANPGQGLATIAGQLGLTKSHCLMILRTLVAEGWVQHDAERQRYALSPALLLDLAATVRRHDRSTVVHDALSRLAMALSLPCLLSRVNEDGSFTCVDRVQGGTGLMINIPIGHRYPADAPSQMRARLAALPEERGRALLEAMPVRAYTAATTTDKALIWQEVQEARQRGFAIGRMEYLEGVMSIATAILDVSGEARMVLQCTGPQAAMAPREAALGRAIMDAAGRIAAAWDILRPPVGLGRTA